MGFLLLFDVTSESSFLSIRNWLTYIDTYTRVDDDLRPPIILIGNKIDLVTHRVIDTMRAQQLANELQITYIETSAVTGTNVPDALNTLVEHIFEFMDKSMQKYYPITSITLRLSTHGSDDKKKASIQLVEKFSRLKKDSCLCT